MTNAAARARTRAASSLEEKGLPTHPPELKYPCCIPALGEFLKMAPRGEPQPILP